MKNFLRSAMLAVTLVAACDINSSTWESLGPRGGTVFEIVRSPDDPRVVLAGTNFGGLYRSADSGISWQHITTGFSNKVVFAIAFDPNNSNILYAGTFEAGIFKSIDSGFTWGEINQGIGDLNVNSIAVSPSNSDHIVIGTGIGAYRTTNGGGTWSFASGLPMGQLQAVVWDPLIANLIYAGTVAEGVFHSIDGGANWAKFDDGMGDRNITSLAIDTDSPMQLYACGSNGIFTRKLDDSSWINISHQISDAACNHILPLHNSSEMLAATNQGIYRLNDLSQASWELVSPIETRLVLANDDASLFHIAASASSLIVTEDFIDFYPSDQGMQNRFAGSLATVSVGNETLIYAGTDVGVEFTSEFFAQPDGSLPWVPGFQFDGAIFGITPHPSRLETIYIGAERGGVWQTDDYGFNWTPRSNGMVPEQVFDLSPVPTAPGKLFAATSSGLFVSLDDGANWAPDSNTAISFPIATVASDPERPDVGFYGTFTGDVFRTLDGKTFSLTWRHPEGAAVKDIVTSRWHNIYLITESGELFASEDVGKIFVRRAEQDISEKVQTVVVDPEEPWVVYAGTVLGGVYKSESNGIEWIQVNNGIDVPIITALGIDKNNPDIVYAGGVGVVYQTTDAGENWVANSGGLPDELLVQDIVVDQANPTVIYATLENDGLYTSVDSGETWSQLQAGTGFLQETSIAMSTSTEGRLFAGTQLLGVQVSNDAGQTFTPSSSGMTPFVRTVAMSRFGDVLYAGSLSAGLFKSTDEAGNWKPTGLSDRNIFNVAIDPNDTDTVFAGTSLGVSRSLDGAQSWQDLGDREAYVFDILSAPDHPGKLYAAGLAGKIYVSEDDGNIWSRLDSELPEGNVISIAIDSGADQLYAAVQDLGVFRYSLLNGAWVTLPAPSSTGVRPLDIAIDRNSGTLLLATNGDGIYRSDNDGDSWTAVSTGLTSDVVVELAYNPLSSNVIYAATQSDNVNSSGLHRSSNGGITWSPIPIPDSSIVSVSASPHTQDRLYAVSDSAQVWLSNDAGMTWSVIDGGLAGVPVLSVHEDPYIANRLVAATSSDAGIYISLNGGGSWLAPTTPQEGDNVAVAFGTQADHIYVANLDSGVLRSFDGGITFDKGHDDGLKGVPVLFLAIDPTNSQQIFAATGGIGVLRSQDGGLTWTQVLADAPLFLSVVIDPDNPQRVYAGSAEYGVFVSHNGGDTWAPFNEGLFNKTVTALAIDPVDSSIIYTGTEGGGVFRRVTETP